MCPGAHRHHIAPAHTTRLDTSIEWHRLTWWQRRFVGNSIPFTQKIPDPDIILEPIAPTPPLQTKLHFGPVLYHNPNPLFLSASCMFNMASIFDSKLEQKLTHNVDPFSNETVRFEKHRQQKNWTTILLFCSNFISNNETRDRGMMRTEPRSHRIIQPIYSGSYSSKLHTVVAVLEAGGGLMGTDSRRYAGIPSNNGRYISCLFFFANEEKSEGHPAGGGNEHTKHKAKPF